MHTYDLKKKLLDGKSDVKFTIYLKAPDKY